MRWHNLNGAVWQCGPSMRKRSLPLLGERHNKNAYAGQSTLCITKKHPAVGEILNKHLDNERGLWTQGWEGKEHVRRLYHANPAIPVTDPQTSAATHWHALIFIRRLVKEKWKQPWGDKVTNMTCPALREKRPTWHTAGGRSGPSENLGVHQKGSVCAQYHRTVSG